MSRSQGIKMTLVFSEHEVPFLLDISSILYDLELLHDLMILTFVEDYYEYKFNRFFYFRIRRPVKPSHKIRAAKIIKESPLTLELVVAAATVGVALGAIVQALDKIGNWRLNREKLRLEVIKLEIDVKKSELEVDEAILRKEGMQIYISLLKRFWKNPIKLEDASFEYIEENREDVNG